MPEQATPPTRIVRFRVSGRVQGVGFRWFVCEAARQLGVSGDVRNLIDGRVEIRAAAAGGSIEALMDEVGRGPRGAVVESVESLEPDPDPISPGFRIRDTAIG